VRRFPKAHRLLKRAEFLAVQRSGGGVRGRHAIMIATLRDDAGPCRLGVVASRRVGNAVIRNRGKRRVREWFRNHDALPEGADLVVILRMGLGDEEPERLFQSLDELCVRAVRKAAKRRQRTAHRGKERTPGPGDAPNRG
jgi:ribonuclease P protein component